MDGIELVARDSLTQIRESLSENGGSVEADAAFAYYSEFVNRDEDERSWSFSNLRNQLRLKDCQDLFRRYQMRVQHALFVELLFLNLLINLIVLCVTAFILKEEHPKASRWCRGTSTVVQAVFFVAAFFRERWFRGWSARWISALVTLACMLIAEMGPALAFGSSNPESQLSSYHVVLTTTVLLPFSRKLYSGSAAVFAAVASLTISALNSGGLDNFHLLLCAEGSYLLVTVLAGLWIRSLMEVMGRRAFLDRRECMESKIKSENEKDRKEKLLHSVLPQHIAKEVRDDIYRIIKRWKTREPGLLRSNPFNKLYVERHKDVSILYADIVNSMLLGASLHVAELVDTLDDLFGQFDEAAQRHNCMRIKLLGDCYYCVSGLKNPNDTSCDEDSGLDTHADNCVNTGLLMIKIIRKVRAKRHVAVDMRIGVHSGSVLGGIVGHCKWQFDIWSRDVTIASHMEQAGIPGHVHITKATRDLLRGDHGEILPGDGHKRDPYLAEEGIKTFLIAPRGADSNQEHYMENREEYYECSTSKGGEKLMITIQKDLIHEQRHSSAMGLPSNRRRRAALDYSLVDFKKMMDEVNRKMGTAIDKMGLGKKDQWFSSEGVQPLFLTFYKWKKLERPYLKQTDPLFKHYMLCSLVIFKAIAILQLLMIYTDVLEKNVEFWVVYGLTIPFIAIATFTGWVGYLKLLSEDEITIQPATRSFLLKMSRSIWRDSYTRVMLWLLMSSTIIGCSITGLSDFKDLQTIHRNATSIVNADNYIAFSRIPVFCVVLALTVTSVFLRLHFFLKLLLKCGALASACFLVMTPVNQEELDAQMVADWRNVQQNYCFYLALVVLILHLLDRQVEYVCRLDFFWRTRLYDEKVEATNMEVVNRTFLENILPKHLVRTQLDKVFRPEAPYHEECSSVAILFASIPKFAQFYSEDELNEAGRRCIQLLNEIVCDFDQLLLEKPFLKVEKIKTIGSTYMAACGLHYGQSSEMRIFNSCSEEDGETEQQRKQKNVVTLASFAARMMQTLQLLNKDAMQDFQLRAGIAVGRVMAGVVGSMRPQYDIWGDAVNVASRMDSTGMPGRIQVTEEVADLIETSGSFECECRGHIFVKGKGELTTYFLKTQYDEDHTEHTQL